jgi:Na+-transporting NADH:ubiquinone oxidoreductase subunit B
MNPAFPEGMMLAILLGNAFSPMIDYIIVRKHIKRRQNRYAQ